MPRNETASITLKILAQDLATGKIGAFVNKLDTLSKRGGIAGRMMQGVGMSMGMMLNPVMLASRAIGTVTSAISGAIESAADFDEAMTKSLAIMGDVSDEMREKMEGAARDVAKATTYSAKEAADAYFYLASAGLDATKSMEAMPVVAQFAQAGSFDLALATDLLTDAQSALGLSVDDTAQNMTNMTYVSDMLVKANTIANATVQQFSESLTNRGAAALKLYGQSMETGVALLAAWASQGVKGAEAGTRLDIVLRDLTTTARKNADAYKEMGISVFDAQGNLRDAVDILADVDAALGGMSDRSVNASLAMLGFTNKSISATASLLGTSKGLKGFQTALVGAGGTTKVVADKQLESFRAKMDLLNSALGDMAISFGEVLIPKIADAADALRTDLLPELERMGEWFEIWSGEPDLAKTMDFFTSGPIGKRKDQIIGLAEAYGVVDEKAIELARTLAYHLYNGDDELFWQSLDLALGSVEMNMRRATLSTVLQGKALDDAAGEAEDLASALELVSGNLDDFNDLTPLGKVNSAIKEQKKLMLEAAKEDKVAAFWRHKYNLQELRGKRKAFQLGQEALQEWKKENQQVGRNTERVQRLSKRYEQSGATVKTVMKNNRGDMEKVRAKLEQLRLKSKAVGDTDPTITVTADTTQADAAIAALLRSIDALGENSLAGTMLGIGHTVQLATATGGNSLKKKKKRKDGAIGGTYYPGDYGLVGERGMERISNVGGVTTIKPVANGRFGSGATINISLAGATFLGTDEDARKWARFVVPAIERERRRIGV